LKNKTYLFLRIALPIIGIIIGGAKIFGVPGEVELFRHLDMSDSFRIVFGVLQVICGIIIIVPELELTGIMTSATLLIVAISLMIAHHMYLTAIVPIAGGITLLVFAWCRISWEENLPFKDKIIIVTGGGAGIGRSLSEELGRRGAQVIVAGRTMAGVNEVVSKIIAAGGRAEALQMDVSRETDVQNGVDLVVSKYGRIDYIINNAGINIAGEMRDLNIEHFREVIDTNLLGTLYGTMAAYRVMIKQRFGHIVNMSSLAGVFPFPANTPYTTAKHAIVGLSTSLRAEARALGVKVSVVCPGLIKTAIWKKTRMMKASNEDMIHMIGEGILLDLDYTTKMILNGICLNQAIIIFPLHAKAMWWLYRLSPSTFAPVGNIIVYMFRAIRKGGKSA
jgi:NAD(P)-dependent dehydrogenase (short-subunit alcohol dehydrogenase family)